MKQSVPPGRAMALLTRAADKEYHEFWPCSVSLLDPAVIDRSRVHRHRQVTDAYLLALAAVNDGRFVTFDRAVALDAVPSATQANLTVL